MKKIYNLRKGIFLLLSLVAFSYSAHSADITWSGGGATTNWSDVDNWNGSVVPGPGDNAVFRDFDAVVTFITSPTVDIVDIRDGRNVILNIGGNTLNVTSSKSNIVKVASNSTLEIASGTLNVIANIIRDAIQFRTTAGTTGVGGSFIVGAGATVNVTGRKGFTSINSNSLNTIATTGVINNAGVINILNVANNDGIALNSPAQLMLVNDVCAVINLGTSKIKGFTAAAPFSNITNNGLITYNGSDAGGGITVNNSNVATNNGFYNYANGANFATGNNGSLGIVVDNGVALNPAVLIELDVNCMIDLTSATGGMIAYNWAFEGITFAANDGGGLLDISGAGFPSTAGPHTITVAGCPEYNISIDVSASDPGCDDGDCTNGLETWDGCECVAGTPPVDPGCDDGDCTNGVEVWDGCECLAGTQPVDPGCDDGDCTNGLETWDGCECVAGTPPTPCVDDGDCTNGFENWNLNTCECDITPPVNGCTNPTATNFDPNATCDDGSCEFDCPDPGNCDDGDCSNGLETWDGDLCECVAGTPPVDPGCDDGDCTNGLETWDGCECVAGTPPVDPGCDDGDCTNGLETWDGCECVAGSPPVDPGCDDGDCTNGLETWDGCECVAGTPPVDPGCDDGCEFTIDVYDTDLCDCVFTLMPPTCDDGCENTMDSYDEANCECINTLVVPDCDDGCENTTDTYNEASCACEHILVAPDCDDGCEFTADNYNETTCECENILTVPACDDNDCSNGVEVWNEALCECETTPVDCSNSPTTVLPCNDGDPCTMNDVQVVLDCDGTICQPCMGEDTVFLADFAEDDEYEVSTDESLIGNLLSNDDIDNLNNLTIQLSSNPGLGVIILNQDGSFEYTPETDFSGIEEFDYIVCASDCAEACASATVIINIISNVLVIPNAISPNGDGINDTWIIPGLLDREQRKMTVINRWGDVVYRSDSYNNDWDGTNSTNGKPLPEGTYYYFLEADVAAGESFKGSITIIR